MASAPFGDHPTFAQYREWAVQTGGCRTRYGILTASDGLPSRVVIISSEDDERWVVVADVADGEFLVPTMVGHLDRRLGLKSPFSSIDLVED